MRSPILLELASFPFLNDNVDGNSGQDPLKIINALTNGTAGNQAWVSPKEDSYWVAAVSQEFRLNILHYLLQPFACHTTGIG